MLAHGGTVAELTETITDTIEQIELGDAVSRLADAAGASIERVAEFTESAAHVGAPAVSLGHQAAQHTARNPKKILGVIGIIVAVAALVYWLTNRGGDGRPDPSDHPGVV